MQNLEANKVGLKDPRLANSQKADKVPSPQAKIAPQLFVDHALSALSSTSGNSSQKAPSAFKIMETDQGERILLQSSGFEKTSASGLTRGRPRTPDSKQSASASKISAELSKGHSPSKVLGYPSSSNGLARSSRSLAKEPLAQRVQQHQAEEIVLDHSDEDKEQQHPPKLGNLVQANEPSSIQTTPTPSTMRSLVRQQLVRRANAVAEGFSNMLRSSLNTDPTKEGFTNQQQMADLIMQHLTQARIPEIISLERLETAWATRIPDPPLLDTKFSDPSVSALQEEDVPGANPTPQGRLDQSRKAIKRQSQTSPSDDPTSKGLLYLEVLSPNYPVQTRVQYHRRENSYLQVTKVISVHSSLLHKASIYSAEAVQHSNWLNDETNFSVNASNQNSGWRRPMARYYDFVHDTPPKKPLPSLPTHAITVEVDQHEDTDFQEEEGESFCLICLADDHTAVLCKLPRLERRHKPGFHTWDQQVPPEHLALVRCCFCTRFGHNNCKFEVPAVCDNLYQFEKILPHVQTKPSTNSVSKHTPILDCS